jgi:hypothetical protein
MLLGQIRIALRDDVVAQRHINTYDNARRGDHALRDHATIISALGVLNDDGEHRYCEREAIARALVRQCQQTGESFWASALVISFMPMLARLRCRLRTDVLFRDELTQRVLQTFLETAATISLERHPTRIAMFLRQITQRRLFGELHADEEERRCRDLLRDYAANDPEFKAFEPPTSDEPIGDQEAADLAERLHEIAGDRLPRKRLDVVVATCVGGEKLSAFAERTHDPASDQSVGHTYERIKRERLRVLTKLRPLLHDQLSGLRGSDIPTTRGHDARAPQRRAPRSLHLIARTEDT